MWLSNGATVNVVLRSRADNVRDYHFTSLPKISLGAPLAAPATKTAQKQKGTDR
ncbi:hypothetical protein C7475_101265 [Chitinophaga sp. S165]|nr:hypothetical protein C7475_101265 [Chitinophaga sp. S165]